MSLDRSASDVPGLYRGTAQLGAEADRVEVSRRAKPDRVGAVGMCGVPTHRPTAEA